jgi:ketosteroid isomerase-like protein
MTPEANVEVVRRLFETYSRGDYDEAASCLDPDVVYEVGQEMPALGRAAVRAMWERWDSAWDEMETVPEEMRDGLCVRKAEFRDRAEALQAAGTVP